MGWNIRELIALRVQCTSITKRVLSLFERSRASYNCMNWKVRKLITPRVKCKSITRRVLSLIDRFTTYNNCMSWSIRKLITPRVLCIHITKRILSLFDRFKIFLHFYELNEMSEYSYLRVFSAQVSQIELSTYLTVLPPTTTVWAEVSENS